MDAHRLAYVTPLRPQSSLPTKSILAPTLPYCRTPFFPSTSDTLRCSCVRKPSWDATGTQRSKFYPYDHFSGEREEDDGGFFGSEKTRKWWSDDADDVEDEEDEFWGFKILKAFGWMIPALFISMLLGTGPNALFMAVALPLGQTALSLAVDKVWAMAGQTSKPTPSNMKKSKPFASTANYNYARKRKQSVGFASSKETRSSYKSTGNHQPAQGTGHCSSTSFGGWDELDKEVVMRPIVEEDGRTRQRKNNNVSKRVRNRDFPLFIRLMVAVFPFLGSWARFL